MYVDGDAVWSMLAMRQILTDMGKDVECYTTDTPSVQFDRVHDIDQIHTALDYTRRFDLLIFVDFTEYTRIERLTLWYEDWFDSHHKIIIDHHEVQALQPLTTALIDPIISSTCELLYEIWTQIDASVITPIVATHLYLWLTTDTGNYLHDGNSTQTLQRWLNLVKLLADKHLVQDQMLSSYPLWSLQFLSLFLSRLKTESDIYYSRYGEADLTVCLIDKTQAEIATIMIQSIAHSDIAIIFKLSDDLIRFSLRSKYTPIDHIARHYGGGGHQHASWGGKVERQIWVDIETQLSQIVTEIAAMVSNG